MAQFASTQTRSEAGVNRRLLRKALRQPGAVARVLWSRWRLRRCDHVGRFPRIYGKLRLINYGRVTIGEKLLLMGTLVPCELVTQPSGVLEIGDNVFVNYGVSMSAHQHIRVGNRCQIGNWSILMDNDYHSTADAHKPSESAPIILEDEVWLGARVIVLKGVTIGRGAVIGAGSVVTRDVPPRTLAVGAPARVVRAL